MIDRDAKTFWEEMAMRERLKLVRCEVEAYIAAKGGVQNAIAKESSTSFRTMIQWKGVLVIWRKDKSVRQP